MRSNIAVVAALAAWTSVAPASALQDSKEQDQVVTAAIERYKQAKKTLVAAGEWPKNIAQAADEAMKGVDFARLDFVSLERLMTEDNCCMYTTRRDEIETRLTELSKPKTRDGALAAVLQMLLMDGMDASAQRAIIQRVIAHPALGELLRAGEAWEHFSAFAWFVRRDAVKGLEPQLIAMAKFLPESAGTLGALGAMHVFDSVAEASPKAYSDREPLRKRVVAALKEALKHADPKDPELKDMNIAANIKGYLGDHISRLEGPAVLGTLVGGPAPRMDFLWSSEGKFKSLDDLKGNVVMLDFWTTWCGPCKAAFPKVRELYAHYEGYPVKVIGVTSLQGWHYGAGGRKDCQGKPEKEFELMSQFIEEQTDLVWPVVFSKENVFNPNYGVQGIPHVTIIDPSGRVRFNKVSAWEPVAEKISKIDGLLREFKLPMPATPDKQ